MAKLYSKICEAPECRKNFDTKKESQKFCSPQCSNRHAHPKTAKYVELTCEICGVRFSRLARDEKQYRRAPRKRICCPKKECSLAAKHKSFNEDFRFLKYFLIQCERNKRRKEVSVTLEDLVNQWKKQDGRCPYTGEKLVIKTSRNRGERVLYQASLDRIDSSLGYVPGNIEFVSAIANYAKNVWKKEDVIEFARKVVEHNG